MDSLHKLKLLSAQMGIEPAEETECARLSSNTQHGLVTQAVLPGGKSIALLKTLLTSVCERNCYYCPFRAGRDYRRATFKPDELASTFHRLYLNGIADGIFLSSGVVGGGVRTQDLLIATAEILRFRLNYRGYLHLKLMPGVEKEQVYRSMQLADRVSINLEAPNPERLEKLAPGKNYQAELYQPLRWIEEVRKREPSVCSWNGRWPTSVTQFVVGGNGENDLEYLGTTQHLYRDLKLSRVYYSAFRPVPDTPLDQQPPVSPLREHRLYQASFLIRNYGFDIEELPFDKNGNLPIDVDPKLSWAQGNLSQIPLEVNLADRSSLMRIPGVGPKGALAIMEARRVQRIRDLRDLAKIGLNPKQMAPFITLEGRRPTYQQTLW